MRTTAAFVVVTLFGSIAHASFIVDTFERPTSGTHQSDGTSVNINPPPAGTAQNFFDTRMMNGDAATVLTVSNGGISGAFLPDQTAFIEWTNPTGTDTFSSLFLQDFVGPTVPGATYNVTRNGTSISGGDQAFDSDRLRVDPNSQITSGDVLRVTFSVDTVPLIFTAEGIQANPEPASATLLGLALFCGACRYRRRRRTIC